MRCSRRTTRPRPGEVSPSEVIICPPTFPIYALTASQAGAQLVEVPLQPDTFEYRVDAILDAITDKTRLLYLCSPNNPTGTLLQQAQLDAIMASVPDRVVVVFDEVYYHFVSEPDRPDPIDYVLQDANIVALHSFSKAYGLAGLRLGYAIAKPEIAKQIASLRLPFHLNTLCFEAGMAALADTAHVEKTVEVTLVGRDWLIGQLRELGLDAWPSQSNFVLFRCPRPLPSGRRSWRMSTSSCARLSACPITCASPLACPNRIAPSSTRLQK